MSDTPRTDGLWEDLVLGDRGSTMREVAEIMRDHACQLEREVQEMSGGIWYSPCACGKPYAIGIVHRKNDPCFYYEPPEGAVEQEDYLKALAEAADQSRIFGQTAEEEALYTALRKGGVL